MENAPGSPALEIQLHEQLGEIGRQIARLVAVREGLKRVLMLVNGESAPRRKLPRADGHTRQLIETRVLAMLRSAQGRPVSSRDLLAEVRKSHPTLKDTTFRCQLHRLKKRTLIASHARRGHWHLKG